MYTYARRRANRDVRRKVKQLIYHCGDWDAYVHPDKNEFLDPWDYS